MEADQEKIGSEQRKIKICGVKMASESEKIGSEQEKIEAEPEKIRAEHEKIRADRGKIGSEHEKIKAEPEKISWSAVAERSGDTALDWGKPRARSQGQKRDGRWFVWLREVSCRFVDRALRNRNTVHEITRSSTKEHEHFWSAGAESRLVGTATPLWIVF